MYQWTTEAVSQGHPDKVADQISDAVLDAYLSVNPNLRVACECMLMNDLVVVAGEVSPCEPIDIEAVVRNVLNRIGYDREDHSYDGNKVAILNKMSVQSAEIAQAVAKDDGSIGAGDQGIMFGYATDATKTFMPLAHHLAFKFISALEADISKNRKGSDWGSVFLPDAKTQVTIAYDDDNVPQYVETVVVSTQHRKEVSLKQLQDYVLSAIVPTVESTFPHLFNKLTFGLTSTMCCVGLLVANLSWTFCYRIAGLRLTRNRFALTANSKTRHGRQKPNSAVLAVASSLSKASHAERLQMAANCQMRNANCVGRRADRDPPGTSVISVFLHGPILGIEESNFCERVAPAF